jgi:hypothetical protein
VPSRGKIVHRGEMLLRYAILPPMYYVMIVTLSSFVAFTVVGFFGFPNDPPFLKQLAVGDSWPIFAWFMLLLVSLQVTLLQGHVPRRVFVSALAVLLVSVALAAPIVYARTLLPLFPPQG